MGVIWGSSAPDRRYNYRTAYDLHGDNISLFRKAIEILRPAIGQIVFGAGTSYLVPACSVHLIQKVLTHAMQVRFSTT